MREARRALGLEGRVLLHAGPPLADPTRPPPPMRNAAVLSCLHEGWAKDEREAERMLSSGAVRLEPSFSRSVATPLAAMVSPRTTVAEVADCGRRYFAFLGSGAGPQQRFGSRDPAIVERLAFRETVLCRGFQELINDEPIDLLAIARAGIREGDDLHNRLSSANSLLHALLGTRRAESDAAKAALRTVAEAPLYFLNVWMPACQLMLLAAEGMRSTLVTRLCANGEVIGIQVAALPGRWFTAPAPLVKGPFMKNAPGDQFGPATGDSGVIDAFGLGGQGLRHAPSLMNSFGCWLQGDDDARARSLLAGHHPILETPFALDASLVAKSGRSPLLSTGMVDPDGRGLLGRGLCVVPVQPFADAVTRARGAASALP